MQYSRRRFLKTAAAAASLSSLGSETASAAAGAVTPEKFGAKGDGRSDDSDAFAALADFINAQGGGTVVLRKTTYLVGRQSVGADPAGWAFQPAHIMNFRGLRSPLIIRGSGARLKCAKGLRYGAFDRATGRPFHRPLPYWDVTRIASPYNAMILVSRSSAPVEISDLELDGSLEDHVIGGTYGDTGYQIPAYGLFLDDNISTETVRNIYSHHHGMDGVVINGDDKRRARSRFENVDCEYNGRQGVSIVGGRGYDFYKCRFNHTGRSKIHSSPGAGVDIEAEGTKTNRDFTFTDCEFVNNSGCGLLAEAGDNEKAEFTRCRFIGTTIWSAWPRMPLVRFRECLFVGSLVNAYHHAVPTRAAQFIECKFRDDPRLSPNGKVFLPGTNGHPIVDLGNSDNVRFDRCSFILTHKARLPWSWRATYSNCVMEQASPEVGYPKGTYLGSSTITGNVDLYNSKVIGNVVVNGKTMAKGIHGGNAW